MPEANISMGPDYFTYKTVVTTSTVSDTQLSYLYGETRQLRGYRSEPAHPVWPEVDANEDVLLPSQPQNLRNIPPKIRIQRAATKILLQRIREIERESVQILSPPPCSYLCSDDASLVYYAQGASGVFSSAHLMLIDKEGAQVSDWSKESKSGLMAVVHKLFLTEDKAHSTPLVYRLLERLVVEAILRKANWLCVCCDQDWLKVMRRLGFTVEGGFHSQQKTLSVMLAPLFGSKVQARGGALGQVIERTLRIQQDVTF